MTQLIVEWLKNLIDNEYLLLFVLSITPLFEMRGSVVLSGGMEVQRILACLVSLAGSSIVVLPLLWLFRPIMRWLRKTKLFSPLADLIENAVKTRADQLEIQNKKMGNGIYWALFIFVSIPLPMTGVWIGSLIAAFAKLKFWKSAAAIIMGNVTAAIILNLLIWAVGDYVDIVMFAFLAIALLSALLIFANKWQKRLKQKLEIAKIESAMPPEEKPVIGEFAAGAADEVTVIEVIKSGSVLSGLNKKNNKLIR